VKNPPRLTCLRHLVLKLDICGFPENVAGILRLACLLELAPILEELVLHVSVLIRFCRNPLKTYLARLFSSLIFFAKKTKNNLMCFGCIFLTSFHANVLFSRSMLYF
jgi:hypothetical protein